MGSLSLTWTVRAILSIVVLSAAVPARGEPAQSGAPPAQPPPAEQVLNPTQEIAKETPEGPALTAGPAEIRIGGYLGVTGIYRSTNAGGGTGTSFASVPYGDTLEGNLSEARLSAQSSRLSIRVNAAPAPGRSILAGYFEMDFNESTSGAVAVTSTGVGFRLRHAFGVAQYHDTYAVAAGQAFSLMTPVRDQLSVWPSEYLMSHAVDVNYVAGLVWARLPQVRFTYRRSKAFNWAVSAENPEQQIGSGMVTLPACCAADLGAQFNTGDDALKIPNFMPDIVSRVAFNAGSRFHADAGGVLRVFRDTIKPYAETFKQAGGGVSVNTRVTPGESAQLIGQVSYGAGMGRYVGGLVPDVTVSADGAIHPVRTASWVAGVEGRVGPTSVALYDSGVRIANSYHADTDGSLVGYGYPGASNAANRAIHEITGVAAFQMWSTAGRGSMQWNTQVSWVRRSPWSEGAGPSAAAAWLFFMQIRYNLP